MRLNVYAEELTDDVTLISKVAENTGIKHWGVRIYLASPDTLHHTAADDDRSAITFWVPEGQRGLTGEDLAEIFAEAARAARIAADRVGTRNQETLTDA